MSSPQSICIMRLSAVGDICHTLPVVRTIADAWPDTAITWVVGRLEASLIGDIPSIEFITYDKSRNRQSRRKLRKAVRGRRFDIYLQMQVALRSSMAGLCIRSNRHIGFDRARAADYQWLFTNERIEARSREHVMDSLYGFANAIGLHEHHPRWDIPLSEHDQAFAHHHIPDGRPTLIISPLASARILNWRNWRLERYAAVADYAASLGLNVILTGGPTDSEFEAGQTIIEHCQSRPINLIGQTTLKQLLALIARAKTVITPDSGPAHMATTVDTPVIGLHATTNPDRSGAYNSREWIINRYPQALEKFCNTTVADARWGMRVRHPDAMDLIQVDDVTAMLERVLNR